MESRNGVTRIEMDNEQKEKVLEALRTYGTYKSACFITKIPIEDIKKEMKKHAVFRKHVNEAIQEGRLNVTDEALDKIREYVMNPPAKTDRNQLTAAIALANAYLPGFKGTSKIEGKIEHDVKVISSVPRPDYKQLETKVTVSKEDKDKLKELNSGKPITSIDQAVNEVVEGEVVKEENE